MMYIGTSEILMLTFYMQRHRLAIDDELRHHNQRFGDVSNHCGILFDQQLHLKSMKLQQKRDNDRSCESMIVGLSLEESALARQIEVTEKRAERMSKKGTDPLQCEYRTKVEALLKRDGLMVEDEA